MMDLAAPLGEHEKIEQVNDGIRLISRTDGLNFGTDALLLAGYVASAGRFETAIEIGSGTGIVSMLLLGRERVGEITAVEVQKEYADLTRRNAELNRMDDRLDAIEADVRDFSPKRQVDLVFSNPPYMKADSGRGCATDFKQIARHEVHGTIEELLASAARLLKYGGTLALVYRPDRLADLLCAMRNAGIEPKKTTFVYADSESEPALVLVLGKRGGKPGVRVTPPLLLYTDPANREYTPAMQYLMEYGALPKIYSGK